jgi:hypothetical protein
MPEGIGPIGADNAFRLGSVAARRSFGGDSSGMILRRMFDVPWDRDVRLQPFFTLAPQEAFRLILNPHGVIPRVNGSPLYGTRVPDLHLRRYSRYIDATATHRLRGAEDVARYAALITGADPMEFGTHRMLTDEQRREKYRHGDEVLYAIGVYLLSLEPPKNPNPPPANLASRGEQVFRREKCGACTCAVCHRRQRLRCSVSFWCFLRDVRKRPHVDFESVRVVRFI